LSNNAIGSAEVGWWAAALPLNNKSEKARVLGTRALRDLPTDVKPSCFAKVKLLADNR
jgi:hypothetical protein